MNTVKDKIQSILNQLPDDCSIEDIQYHLYVLEKVHQGLQAADRGGILTQEEVEGLLNKWLIE
jgi:predicted transcriptional regulator